MFENLGVSVMEPGRDPEVSAISYNPDIIIASDAEPGNSPCKDMPISWTKRMTQVVSAVMRKVRTLPNSGFTTTRNRDDLTVRLRRSRPDRSSCTSEIRQLGGPRGSDPLPDRLLCNVERKHSKASGRGEAITRALVTQYLLSD